MVIKVAVPHQFKLKVIRTFRFVSFFGSKKDNSLYRRIRYSSGTIGNRGRKKSNTGTGDRE